MTRLTFFKMVFVGALPLAATSARGEVLAISQTIWRYDSDGNILGTFAANVRMTPLTVVPEPSTVAMATIVAFALAAVALRRRQSLR